MSELRRKIWFAVGDLINMSKGLDALYYLDDIAHGRKMSLDPHELELIIEKELKALEIIKRNPIEVVNLIDTYDTYEEMKQDYYVYGDEIEFIKNKNEFDLLKEIL